MDANERIINRLERLYSHFGASGVVDAFVSIGGHDYREDIRQGVFRFLNTHLKHDSAPVTDTEMDLVTGNRDNQHPIRPEELRVFPKDENIPSDALNGRIDEHFVEIAEPELPKTKEEFTRWKETLVGKLREVTFRHFPEGIPSATLTREEENGFVRLKTEGNIEVRGRVAAGALENADVITMIVSNEGLEEEEKWVGSRAVFVLEPRGIGATKWTTKNPPNYVERSHYLLGRTVDSGRVWDIIAAAKYLKKTYPKTRLQVNGEGRAGVLAIFAALLEDRIDWVSLGKIPLSLMDGEAPALLNALRVCDVPEALGMLAGRVRLEGEVPEKTRNIFMKAGHQ
jgi:hypothetical protein